MQFAGFAYDISELYNITLHYRQPHVNIQKSPATSPTTTPPATMGRTTPTY